MPSSYFKCSQLYKTPYWLRWCTILIYFLLLFNFGCFRSFSGEGRWDRYKGGGSFGGTRPSMSPDQLKIIYSTPKSGKGDIYCISMENKKVSQLTNNQEYEGDPTWSPDGSQIAFIREKEGRAHIWIMNADGSSQKQLTKGDYYDSSPSFSPDGLQLVFSRERNLGIAFSSELYILNLKSKELSRVTNNREADWEPSLSPDGDRILYSLYSQQIATIRVDGTDQKILALGSTPAFSPDGSQIVFLDKFKTWSIVELFLMDHDGKNKRRLSHLSSFISHPSFTKNSSKILALNEPHSDGTGMIILYDIETNTVQNIVDTNK